MKSVVFAIAVALVPACDTPDDMLPIQPSSGSNVIGKGEPGDDDGTGTLDAGTGLGDGGFANDGGVLTDAGEFTPLVDGGTPGTDQIPNDGGTDQIPDEQTDQIPDDQTDQIPGNDDQP